MTETRGTGTTLVSSTASSVVRPRSARDPTGSLVADRRGMTTAYSCMNLQERGQLLVGPGVEVYEGMIVGETRALVEHRREPHEGEEAHQPPRRVG